MKLQQGFVHEQGPLQSYAKRSLSITTPSCKISLVKGSRDDLLLKFKMNDPFSCKLELDHLDFESSELKSPEETRLFTVVSPHDVQFISTVFQQVGYEWFSDGYVASDLQVRVPMSTMRWVQT